MGYKDFPGKRLKKLRKERGFSQQKLADAICVSRSYMSMLETGRRELYADVMESICKALDVDANDLLGIPRKDEKSAVDEVRKDRRDELLMLKDEISKAIVADINAIFEKHMKNNA